jgi:ABC-type tungstate transport system permease subunit
MMKGRLATILAALACVTLAAAAADAQARLRVAADRSLEASGFLAWIGPLAAKAVALQIEWMPAESAQVIRLARQCGVDAILVAEPREEDRLMTEGVGALRFRVMKAGAQQFDVIAINPGACSASRIDAALTFLQWLTSKPVQSQIAEFSPRGPTGAFQPNAGTETCPTCEAQQ